MQSCFGQPAQIWTGESKIGLSTFLFSVLLNEHPKSKLGVKPFLTKLSSVLNMVTGTLCFNCREIHDSLFNALNLQNRNFRFRSKFFDFIDLKFVRTKFRHTNFKTTNFVVFQIFRRAENCAYRFLH